MASTVTYDRRVNRLLKWLDKQRASHLDMVTDAGDASMWCKEEAELIRDHMKTVETMRREIEELAQVRDALDDLVSWFSGGPSSYGPWIIKAGEGGADAAVEAARAALSSREASRD